MSIFEGWPIVVTETIVPVWAATKSDVATGRSRIAVAVDAEGAPICETDAGCELKGFEDLMRIGARSCSFCKNPVEPADEGGIPEIVLMAEDGGGRVKLDAEAPVDGGKGGNANTDPDVAIDGVTGSSTGVGLELRSVGDRTELAVGGGGGGGRGGVTEGGGGGLRL